MFAFGAEYTAAYWFQKGNEFYNNGYYELALDCYNKSIELDPLNTSTLTAIESVNLGLSKINSSQFYDKAIMIDPTSAGAWAGKGNILQEQGKYDEAIKAYNNAIAIDPNDSCTLWDKGMALNNQGKFDDAIQAFDRGIQIDPKDDELWEQKVWDLYIMGRYNESIAVLDNAIQIVPGDASYLNFMKGTVFESSGRYNEEIAALNESNGSWDSDKGDAFYGLGKYRSAIESYNKSIEQNQSISDNWYKIGLSLQALGLNSDAQEAFTKAKRLGLSEAAALVDKGNALRLSGRYNESIEAYNRAIDLDPKCGGWFSKIISLRALHRDVETNAVFHQMLTAINPISTEICWPNLPGHPSVIIPTKSSRD